MVRYKGRVISTLIDRKVCKGQSILSTPNVYITTPKTVCGQCPPYALILASTVFMQYAASETIHI
jgi:hypothetical protein